MAGDRFGRGAAVALVAGFLLALALAGCGARSYPLKTCVVCDGAFGEGGPMVFVHEGQTVQVCSEGDRQKFFEEPERFMKKIMEVKVL